MWLTNMNKFWFCFSIVHTAVSSTGVDKGPKDEVNPEISVFFVVYMTIAPFFFLNVFIAMITVAFQTEDTNKNICGLTTSQVSYVIGFIFLLRGKC